MENQHILELIDKALANSYNTTVLYNVLDELTSNNIKLQYRTSKVDYTIVPTQEVLNVLELNAYRYGGVNHLKNSKFVSLQSYYPNGNKLENVQITELTPTVLGKILGAIKLNAM